MADTVRTCFVNEAHAPHTWFSAGHRHECPGVKVTLDDISPRLCEAHGVHDTSCDERIAAQAMPRLQLAVLYNDHTHMYYPVDYSSGGWKIDAPSRCLVVGRGVPRTYIPLDQVRSFDIEDVPAPASEVHGG